MDLDDQADDAWLLSVQRKLFQWSRTHPEDSYRDLWNWITDIRNLRCTWRIPSTCSTPRCFPSADGSEPWLR